MKGVKTQIAVIGGCAAGMAAAASAVEAGPMAGENSATSVLNRE